MVPRLLELPSQSFFLLGPRGTGKSTWLRGALPDAAWFDLLDSDVYLELAASPAMLGRRIPDDSRRWVVIDEVQRIPELLNEVHRLIESRGLRFALTGSSARKLRRGGVNLLAGRALSLRMHPLCAAELGPRWSLAAALGRGGLPMSVLAADPQTAAAYLASYAGTYLREEVQQEALTRNLPAFARFLQVASFSQAAQVNVTAVASECGIGRKVAASWFEVLDDLLLGVRLPLFAHRAARATLAHPKFFYFDAGVYRALRPRGPLDSPDEIDGAALETVLLQEIRAYDDARALGYELSYWRTRGGDEVDLVAYGAGGLLAFEVKRSHRLRTDDLRGLRAFGEAYPSARRFVFYGGDRELHDDGIHILPFESGIRSLPAILGP